MSLLIEFLLSSAPSSVTVSCLLSITVALPFHMPEIYTIVFRLLVFLCRDPFHVSSSVRSFFLGSQVHECLLPGDFASIVFQTYYNIYFFFVLYCL